MQRARKLSIVRARDGKRNRSSDQEAVLTSEPSFIIIMQLSNISAWFVHTWMYSSDVIKQLSEMILRPSKLGVRISGIQTTLVDAISNEATSKINESIT